MRNWKQRRFKTNGYIRNNSSLTLHLQRQQKASKNKVGHLKVTSLAYSLEGWETAVQMQRAEGKHGKMWDAFVKNKQNPGS